MTDFIFFLPRHIIPPRAERAAFLRLSVLCALFILPVILPVVAHDHMRQPVFIAAYAISDHRLITPPHPRQRTRVGAAIGRPQRHPTITSAPVQIRTQFGDANSHRRALICQPIPRTSDARPYARKRPVVAAALASRRSGQSRSAHILRRLSNYAMRSAARRKKALEPNPVPGPFCACWVSLRSLRRDAAAGRGKPDRALAGQINRDIILRQKVQRLFVLRLFA